MENKDAQSSFYTISQLTQFTGLTDRTIRSYLASGVLVGEKTGGSWRFTPEQVDAFLKDPAVRPSILAKKNSLVYDFIAWNNAPGEQACMILDYPGEDEEKLTEYFCTAINRSTAVGLEFSFESLRGVPRVILKGKTQDVLRLASGWYARETV